MILPLKTCFSENKTLNWVQTQRTSCFLLNFASIFLPYLAFLNFLNQKSEKYIFVQAFGVHSTQMPVKIYNTRKKLTKKGGDIILVLMLDFTNCTNISNISLILDHLIQPLSNGIIHVVQFSNLPLCT